MREKVGKIAKHCVFPMICGSGGSKSRLAKAAGAEPTGQMRDEKLQAVVARRHLQVKMYKTPGSRSIFGSWDVEKVHAVVARSTFRSQNVQCTTCSRHFWRSDRFAWQAQGIAHLVKNEQNVRVLSHSQLQPPLHHTTLQYATLHYNCNCTFTTFHYITSTTVHSTTLHCTQLHSITLNYTQLHSITLNYTQLHSITLRSTPLHYTTLPLHFTTLHYITLQYTPQHYNYNYNYATTQLHSTTLNYTTLHYTTLHYTTLHSLHYTTFHYTSLHYTTLHSTTLQLQLQLQLHSTTLHYTPLH